MQQPGTDLDRLPRCIPPLPAAKLPGAPVLVTALDAPGSAEMTTDQARGWV